MVENAYNLSKDSFNMLHYLFALWLSIGNITSSASELLVTVQNIKTVKGKIYMAVYNTKKGFLDIEQAVTTKIATVKGKRVVIRFKNLKPGYYAIATYHDKNNDGRMNKNLMGIPTEYYGFSRDARARFSAPSFEDAKFYFKGGSMSTVINLK